MENVMPKPRGGRGLVAPYETTHIRIPVPIKPQIEALIDQYRESLLTGQDPERSPECFIDWESVYKAVNLFIELEDLEPKLENTRRYIRVSVFAQFLSWVEENLPDLECEPIE